MTSNCSLTHMRAHTHTHTHTGTHCIGKTDVLKFPMHILNTWAIFVVMFVSAKRKKKGLDI